MEYRNIGSTGMKAGIVGLGAEYLDGQPYSVVEETIREAMEHGINMMDCFMPGQEVRRNIGRAISGSRDKWLIQGHIGSVDIHQQYDISRDLPTCQRYFEDLLKYLGTDYIDVGMLFFIDSEEDFQKVFHGEILEYARKLKQQGTIRAIGASSHNPVTAAKVVETGEIDLLMFSINPAFDMVPADKNVLNMIDAGEKMEAQLVAEPKRAGLYKLCAQKNVAITVMKSLGAGKLLRADMSPFGKAMSVGQCLHYALTRPAVVSALPGCCGAEHVRQAAGYLSLTEEQKDYASIIDVSAGSFDKSCMYCNHCLPCPADINIGAVNRCLDVALLDTSHIPPQIVQEYNNLGAGGANCIQCKSCEKRCPFGVDVTGKMALAAEIFGR